MRMDVEARTQAIGRELFERTRRAASVAERWTGALFEGSLGHDEARLQLFRFIDVLPALGSDAEVARHLREYFEGRPAPFPRLVRAALGLASRGRLGERIVGAVLRETVRRLARRFIVGATPEEAVRAAPPSRRSPSSGPAGPSAWCCRPICARRSRTGSGWWTGPEGAGHP